jgi:parallel beta-helix repeat protein
MKALAALVFALAVSLVHPALAGPITPPPGPVTATHKTLSEVEPRIAINATNTPGDSDSLFKITQRGSYYVTGNITGVLGKHGIEIGASGVTLDLNGFDLNGVSASLDGVSVTLANSVNTTVINGSVRNWGGEGLDLGSLGGRGQRVEGVIASANGAAGIRTGVSSTITNCAAFQNSGNGFTVGTGGSVTNCSAYQNNADGFSIGNGGTVTSCSGYQNTSRGFSIGNGGTATDCSAYLNEGDGFFTGDGSTLTNCTATNNTGSGIRTSDHNTLTNCTASFNSQNGIYTFRGCAVANCTASFNSQNGIVGNGDLTSVTDCTASDNTGAGIIVEFGGTVQGCVVTVNRDGIVCGSNCLILNNSLIANGSSSLVDGAHILAKFDNNRIEGNNCAFGDRGIDVNSAGNIIIRNTCSDNTTNWDIAADNVVGPILDRRFPGSAAINGNSAPSSLGTTDPNANFTY